MVFVVLCCIAILSQLNAQHGPTWPQLGAQNRPKNLPKMASKSNFQRKTENLEFWQPSNGFAGFFMSRAVPRGPFSLKNSCLDTTCNPTGFGNLFETILVMKMSKFGSQLGPQHGIKKLQEKAFFDLRSLLAPSWASRPSKKPSWGHLGAILGPSWGYLGAILEPFWNNFGFQNVASC